MYKNVFLDLPFISSFGDGIGFMISVLDSGVNIRGLSPGWENCVMFFSKTLYSHSNLSPPRCIKLMGTCNFTAGGVPCNGLASHPGGSRNTPSHFMMYRNRDKSLA